MKYDHTHKYKRILLGKNDYYVYRCMIPGCNHYIQMEAAVGRETICWGVAPDCLGKLFITEKNIELKTVHPICEKCKEYKREKVALFQTIPMIEGEEENDI